jgi:tetratricopeptide (TPR) repeat protein
MFDPTLRRPKCRLAARKWGRAQHARGVASAGLILICLGLFVWVGSASDLNLPAQAQRAFWEALKRYEAEPGNGQAAWQFARACFDRAEFATNSTERAQIADLGIAACQQLIVREPKSAPAHYYLGMNLGQLAQTKGLGALKIVDQMQREFSIVRDLDHQFDYAGADRALGLLYRDAPAIASIGSRSKARHHLQCAKELAPDYPENGLNLIEAYLKWSDRNGARRELKALEDSWARARKNLAGERWAASWTDWEKRLKQVKKKIEEAPKPLEAPRNKE